jgi:hypothetical protein
MQKSLANPPAASGSAQNIEHAIKVATVPPQRRADVARRTPPRAFHPGQTLSLTVQIPSTSALSSVRLHYRHVNQGERWLSTEMQSGGGGYTATIPAEYTDSVYPLEYYFDVRSGEGSAWFHPAFNSTFSNQPYYAISKREA